VIPEELVGAESHRFRYADFRSIKMLITFFQSGLPGCDLTEYAAVVSPANFCDIV
jgi:hypothetical protein